jgi:16S rRNA (guanine966-N2)-methyltransferase
MDAVEDAIVLDGYAGSGALGIEALSRGAARCTFVERDRDALAALRANLAALGLGPDRATVVAGDLDDHLATPQGTGYDLALLDPPYAFDDWDGLLTTIDATVAVCEGAAPVDPPDGWRLARAKAYGGTVVSIVVKEPTSSPEGTA